MRALADGLPALRSFQPLLDTQKQPSLPFFVSPLLEPPCRNAAPRRPARRLGAQTRSACPPMYSRVFSFGARGTETSKHTFGRQAGATQQGVVGAQPGHD